MNIILLIVVGFYLVGFFLMMGIFGAGSYYMIQEMKLDPISTINQYMIFYLISDLIIRYMFQKFNPLNIKPLLLTNIPRIKIVDSLIKLSIFSVFTLYSLFFFVPMIVFFAIEETNTLAVVLWGSSLFLLTVLNNFVNLFLNKNNRFFNAFIGLSILFGALHYLEYFTITDYTKYFFEIFYVYPFLILAVIALIVWMYVRAQKFYFSILYLDKGLEVQKEKVDNLNLSWLEKYGITGTFLKLDVKMLLRNKRSKSAVVMSFVFVFYGLLFFTGFSNFGGSDVMNMFAAIFVTGGFIFSFGNYIPSWDSSYYPLMMTQNITYVNYLKAKWWLMVLGTLICLVLSTFYLYYGVKIYMMVVAAAIFNIGLNSYMVMWSGAYVKTPIDLTSNKNVMGDKTAFNIKSILLVIPKLILPIMLYFVGTFISDYKLGCLLVALSGVAGFGLRNVIFSKIQQVYKIEKYTTLQAYKQK